MPQFPSVFTVTKQAARVYVATSSKVRIFTIADGSIAAGLTFPSKWGKS